VKRSALSVDVRQLLEDHVAEVTLVDVLDAQPYRDAEPLEVVTGAVMRERAKRQHEATKVALAIIARENRGESSRPPFGGVLAALRALDAARIDGAPLRSTSDPARFEAQSWGGSGASQGDAAQRAVERIAPVSRLWALCLADGWTLTTYPVEVRLSAEQARAVVVWSVLGVMGSRLPMQHPQPRHGEGVRQQKPKARIAMRGSPRGRDEDVDPYTEPLASEIAAYASQAFGVEVPVGHVVTLRREGLLELYRAMSARGLVPLDRRLTAMAASRATPWDLQGWKEIATTCGCSERTVRYLSDEKSLPVYKTFAGVVAVKSELQAWMAEHLASGRRPPKPRKRGE
jgi:hypothetical protein